MTNNARIRCKSITATINPNIRTANTAIAYFNQHFIQRSNFRLGNINYFNFQRCFN